MHFRTLDLENKCATRFIVQLYSNCWASISAGKSDSTCFLAIDLLFNLQQSSSLNLSVGGMLKTTERKLHC
eukprot:5117409-Amphidinium_carterae.1